MLADPPRENESESSPVPLAPERETPAGFCSAQQQRTFRDPAGWVELHPDAAYRFVVPEAQGDLLAFLHSPLAQEQVAQGRIVDTEVLSTAEAKQALGEQPDPALQVLRHPLVHFVSYPWEWCPAQWMAAAELTLTLNRELLPYGWILKDATPLNILFQGSRPVLVDVASVARLEPNKPIWYAYAQFVRTFLLPMVAHTSLGWPLRSAILRRDGWEPEDLYPALPVAQRLRQPALSAITLPSMLGRKKRRSSGTAEPSAVQPTRDPELVQQILARTTSSLLKQMRRAMPPAKASTWTAYAGTASHYSEADHASKRSFVVQVLQAVRPKHVLDVGANAGVYSELAADAGARVVAIDTDLQTLDRLFQQLDRSHKEVLPLLVNLANPTPGAGWLNREFSSFLERAAGRFDTVMMLAVIHHLLLHDHIPMAAVAALTAQLTTRTLIIEWVPPTDTMFRELVRGREAIFAGLTEAAFRQQFAPWFRPVREKVLDNGRVLFHMEKIADR